ncbi:nitrate reductase gamma subunit [Beggiatoa alba B18LD]|uniref:Nitrate reductase gamma subunit n=1 Tax=Beggiatoa alba B18LD TaxID=395493 RepID=I3CF67_9GAMM|nr:respiratory nitrate reductase subunit gamma [Beggiatoa alba]EIJ42260.1 nitrate reductase gamma subunit [Beggiatoa alba B18LD]
MTELLTAFYALSFYLATSVFFIGTAVKIYQYATTPAPLKIPLTPAPLTLIGVIWRQLKEILFFRSLFYANSWIWLFSWSFHIALIFIFLRHLRYILDPIPPFIFTIQPLGIYAGFIFIFGLIGLLLRRLCLERIRYISSPSDYLMLLLLLLIAGSGLLMRFILHTDIVQFKIFMRSLFSFQWQAIPTDPVLLLHLGSALLLLLLFPFSKLLHATGVFFSPSRYQVDNSRT